MISHFKNKYTLIDYKYDKVDIEIFLYFIYTSILICFNEKTNKNFFTHIGVSWREVSCMDRRFFFIVIKLVGFYLFILLVRFYPFQVTEL